MIFFAVIMTFIFTALLTIAGEGAAIILIPIFVAMGFDLRVAMSTALLLNAIAMISASLRYSKKKLILYKLAVPIIISSALFSNLGARVSEHISANLLNGLFIVFLVYAALKMLVLKPKATSANHKENTSIKSGITIGIIAGFIAGLLGIGGGNLIIPVLIGMGVDSKNASATTAFIVIFSSLSGFFGHWGAGSVNISLILFASIASITGAYAGSILMTDKLNSEHVKKVIGFILLLVASKKIWNLIILFI